MGIKELGQIPIARDNPSGGDVRFEEDFEALQSEIDKLTSPTSAEGIDWEKVVTLGREILSRKSKHLLVASYLCAALIRTRGFEGFDDALHVYSDLLENFWDTLFPPRKRMRGRLNAVEWWRESTIEALNALPPDSALTPEKLQGFHEQIEAIGTFLDEHTEDAPSMHQLLECLAKIEIPMETNDDQVETPGLPEAKPERPPEPIPAVVDEKPEAAGGDPRKIMQGAFELLRQASGLYFKTDASNVLSYRFARMAAWSSVLRLPPAEDHKTRIPPPDMEIRNALKNLRQQKQFAGLLESAETRVGQFLFWLDLSRYVAEALDALNYGEAHDTVVEDTALYVRRLSGIEALTFSDGTPFADEDTRLWLKDIAMDGSSDAGGIAAIPHDTAGDSAKTKIMEASEKAEALVKQKKLEEAVALIQEGLRGSTSQKSRFLWRVVLARLLVNAKKARLALPHVWEILSDIERHHLDDWDPELVLSALAEVHKSLKAQSDRDLQAQAVEAMDRIAKLNPVAALRLVK